jgi:serine/threonine protein kinase
MKLEEKNLIVERSYKKVYRCEDTVVKVFESSHSKADVFNEALNVARVEETGLNIPKVTEVAKIGDGWALAVEYKPGKTLEQLMEEHPERVEKYIDDFVDLQLEVTSKVAPLLTRLKDKLSRQINSLSILDASTRYELLTRLEGMPRHHKVCHGDFNPSNIIVGEGGSYSILDWSHVTQGNAGADVANTYLQFSLKNQKLADYYMKSYCSKSDTPMQYIQMWLPIVAAAQLTKKHDCEKEFLMKWIDVMDYQ